jgi:hypothetical protein
MTVSDMIDDNLSLTTRWAIPVAIFGMVAIFATYWDEAWHTDVGRDSAWAVPHLVLYGAVGVVGLSVVAWGVRVLAQTRSIRATIAYRPLLAASLGGAGALVAAPLDAYWHEAFGRDAVLWSPPHMLVVFASTGLALGVLAGLPSEARTIRVAVGALLLGNAAAVVFEYEADVPQFTETLYVPVLLLGTLLIVPVLLRAVPGRLPVTTVVVIYAVLRLLIMVGLTLLGRSTPDLPLAVLGLAAADLPLRSILHRIAAAAAGVASIASLAAGVGLASQDPRPVLSSSVAIAALIMIGLAIRGRTHGTSAAALFVALASVGMVLGDQHEAQAHDPGQGEKVADVVLMTQSDSRGSIYVAAKVADHCDLLADGQIVARRAGETVLEPLSSDNPCTYTGTINVPPGGRWFVYATFQRDGRPVESWLPVDTDAVETTRERRDLYLAAASSQSVGVWQSVLGGLTYLAGGALLIAGIVALHNPSRKATT